MVYLTVKETSAALRCHENTVRRLIAAGLLDARRPGRRLILITRASVEARLAAPFDRRAARCRML